MKLRERSDAAVIAAWTILLVVLACARGEFIGDGLRHVADATAGVWKLGEPRWLLFPGMLTAWVSLWRGLGVEPSTGNAINLFLALDVISGTVFLVAIWELLRHLQVSPGRRALALALAGACGPFLELSTNTAEPMPAAALAAAGLVIAAKARPDSDFSWRAVAGVTIISAAGLLYQGMVLALGLVPAITPRGTLFSARTLLVAAAFSLVVWGGAVAALARSSSAPLVTTAARFTKNGDNDLYARWLKSSSSTPRLVAAVAGPASGVSMPPHFAGLRAMLEGVRRMTPVFLVQALALAVGGVVFWVLLGSSVLRRRGWLVAAVCAIMILPLLRPSQYAYSKFYVLMPVFVALAAAPLKTAVTALLSSLLLPVNAYLIVHSLAEGRALFAERARAYEAAGAGDCWVARGWAPAIPQLWPGRTCSVVGELSAGHGSDTAVLVATQRRSLETCLRWCYCDARGVFTDDMLLTRFHEIRELASHFQASELMGRPLLWTDEAGPRVFRGVSGPDVLQFSDRARREACASLGR